MPALCSALAAVISAMMSVTRRTLATTSSIVLPASPTRRAGVDLLHRVADQRLDFLGRRGRTLRQAAHFGGHHRKAAALLAGARRFHRGVQRQDIGLEGDAVDHADDVDDLLRRRVDRRPSSRPPGPPLRRPWPRSPMPSASWLAWRALSAFCLTVEVSSSIDDAVSSSELACCSVREDRSWLPAAIWPDAVAMVSVPLRTSPTIFVRLSFISRSARSSWPVSFVLSTLIERVRSPAAELSRANFRGKSDPVRQICHLMHANARDNELQQQHQGKTHSQADADFEIR
jgi:hypothetical protein